MLSLFCVLMLTTCRKQSEEVATRTCNETELTGLFSKTDTNLLLPLGSDNFWIYDDSVRVSNDTLLTLKSTNFLLHIQKYFLIDNQKSYRFNQLLGQLTTRNDTIFTTEYLPDLAEPTCYRYRPRLMRVSQRTYLNADNTEELFPENGWIQTKMGSLPYQFVYNNANALKYYINDQIGIIRIEFITDHKLKRSLTLNNYALK